MKTKLSSVKFYFYTCLAFLITAVILLFPAEGLSFALKGLNLWFDRMIPTLFPFMVLSGIIIRMDLTDTFVKILNPVLGSLFRIRPACVYGMLVGFLCGFPMGAHVADFQSGGGLSSFLLQQYRPCLFFELRGAHAVPEKAGAFSFRHVRAALSLRACPSIHRI